MKYKSILRPVIDNIEGYSPRFVNPAPYLEPEIVESPIINEIPEVEEVEKPKNKEEAPKEIKSKVFSGKNELLNTMVPLYKKILSEKGLNPEFAKSLAAQDGLESAWGTKQSGKFNLGGIKGKGTTKRTREVINGKSVYINDSFRDFSSLEDYAKYKVNLLNNERYRAFSGGISEFADRVARGGYATAPNYASALNNIITSAKKGGILKFQAGGTGEIRPDNRSWFRKQIDNLATKYNSSTFANSALAEVIAGFGGPFGILHYALGGDEEATRIATLPGAIGVNNLAKDAIKEAEKGINVVYNHYGDNLAKYMRGAIDKLRNYAYGTPPISERAAVPKRILGKNIISGGKFGHDYAFWMDPKTRETILKINPYVQHPIRTGEKAAAKQLLQELVGTTDDLGIVGLSAAEQELFPKKFLNSITKETSAKDVYSRLMGLKAEGGITSSFDTLTPEEAKKLYDMAWDANVFYPTTSSRALQNKETFWKENKDQIMSVFKRLPAIAGPVAVGYSIVEEKNGGIIKAQDGSDTKQWVDNWLSQRKDKLKENAISSVRFALPGIIRNPYYRQSASMNKYSFSRDSLPKEVLGRTNRKEKTIVISDGDKSIEVHEWAHAAIPVEQIAKIKEIINKRGRKLNVPKDSYLDNPDEIYSRLMQLRYDNNLDPNHEYSIEEVWKLRDANNTGDYYVQTDNGIYEDNINNPKFPWGQDSIRNVYNSEKYKNSVNIFERYDDSTIQQLLNDVADNKKADKTKKES